MFQLCQPYSLPYTHRLFCSIWVNKWHPLSGLALFSSGSFPDKDEPDSGPVTATTCIFEGNNAVDGGAVYSAAGYDGIKDCLFKDNLAGMSPRMEIPNIIIIMEIPNNRVKV